MAIKKPDIDIAFKQKATSAINKSNRGIAILILKNDETENCPSYAVYKEITEFEAAKSKYSADNQQAINDIFTFPPSKVIVVNADTVANSLTEIEINTPTGWITIADGEAEDFATLVSWAKTKESKVTLVVQINGKVRDKIEIEMGLDQEHIKELALNTPRIKELINNQPIKKVIVVPNKLVSIVL